MKEQPYFEKDVDEALSLVAQEVNKILKRVQTTWELNGESTHDEITEPLYALADITRFLGAMITMYRTEIHILQKRQDAQKQEIDQLKETVMHLMLAVGAIIEAGKKE